MIKYPTRRRRICGDRYRRSVNSCGHIRRTVIDRNIVNSIPVNCCYFNRLIRHGKRCHGRRCIRKHNRTRLNLPMIKSLTRRPGRCGDRYRRSFKSRRHIRRTVIDCNTVCRLEIMTDDTLSVFKDVRPRRVSITCITVAHMIIGCSLIQRIVRIRMRTFFY